jgi:hypothetical protein
MGRNVKQKAGHFARKSRLLEPLSAGGAPTFGQGIYPMRSKSLLAILVMAAALAGAPVRAEDCPAKSNGMDDVIAAPGCDRAMKVFEACALGASGDVQFGDAVQQKCEADFQSRLKPPQKRAYDNAMRVCDRKYRNESGTMYQSFTAFCRAEVAQRNSKQARKTAR